MYKKFIYWLLRKQTIVLGVSFAVSDEMGIIVRDKDQYKKLIAIEASNKLAREIIDNYYFTVSGSYDAAGKQTMISYKIRLLK